MDRRGRALVAASVGVWLGGAVACVDTGHRADGGWLRRRAGRRAAGHLPGDAAGRVFRRRGDPLRGSGAGRPVRLEERRHQGRGLRQRHRDEPGASGAGLRADRRRGRLSLRPGQPALDADDRLGRAQQLEPHRDREHRRRSDRSQPGLPGRRASTSRPATARSSARRTWGGPGRRTASGRRWAETSTVDRWASGSPSIPTCRAPCTSGRATRACGRAPTPRRPGRRSTAFPTCGTTNGCIALGQQQLGDGLRADVRAVRSAAAARRGPPRRRSTSASA